MVEFKLGKFTKPFAIFSCSLEKHSNFISSSCFIFLGSLPQTDSPVFIRGFKDCETIVGSETKLECQFSGSPIPDVEWFKDGGPLEKNERIICTVDQDVASLTISKTESDDEGWYRCRISNQGGVASIEAELIVVDVPNFVKGLEDLSVDEGMEKETLQEYTQS